MVSFVLTDNGRKRHRAVPCRAPGVPAGRGLRAAAGAAGAGRPEPFGPRDLQDLLQVSSCRHPVREKHRHAEKGRGHENAAKSPRLRAHLPSAQLAPGENVSRRESHHEPLCVKGLLCEGAGEQQPMRERPRRVGGSRLSPADVPRVSFRYSAVRSAHTPQRPAPPVPRELSVEAGIPTPAFRSDRAMVTDPKQDGFWYFPGLRGLFLLTKAAQESPARRCDTVTDRPRPLLTAGTFT